MLGVKQLLVMMKNLATLVYKSFPIREWRQRLRVTESVKRETGQSERVRVKQKGLLFMQRKTGNHFGLRGYFLFVCLGYNIKDLQ